MPERGKYVDVLYSAPPDFTNLCECSHAYDPYQISLVWLNPETRILNFIEQCRIRHRFCARRVTFWRQVVADEPWHLIVIPVGKCEHELVVVLSGIWRVWVMN